MSSKKSSHNLRSVHMNDQPLITFLMSCDKITVGSLKEVLRVIFAQKCLQTQEQCLLFF